MCCPLKSTKRQMLQIFVRVKQIASLLSTDCEKVQNEMPLGNEANSMFSAAILGSANLEFHALSALSNEINVGLILISNNLFCDLVSEFD